MHKKYYKKKRLIVLIELMNSSICISDVIIKLLKYSFYHIIQDILIVNIV